MPLHPVPIIIGTTLAVIGGGMAFKKVRLADRSNDYHEPSPAGQHANDQFVYDPHLAPYIDAFIAAHTPTSHRESRRPIPVPVESTAPAYARSTARRDRGVELRRRRVSDAHDESRQPLLSPAHGDPDTAGRVDTYEPYMPSASAYSNPQPPLRRFSRDQPSYLDLQPHLDRPSSPQDAEVRQVIFNQPLTPLRPESAAPAAMSVNVFHPYGAAIPDIMTSPPKTIAHPLHPSTLEAPSPRTQPESTAFSFLSLSQVSSPEAPHAMLGSMTASASLSLGNALDQWAAVPRSAERRDTLRLDAEREGHGADEGDDTSAIDHWADVRSFPEVRRGAREEDVISLPETSTSGYEDAESYSPGVMRSPVKIHTALLGPSPSRSVGGLGLDSGRVVEVETGVSSAGRPQLPRARDSVISLSESEGWTGMSDFEGSHMS